MANDKNSYLKVILSSFENAKKWLVRGNPLTQPEEELQRTERE